MKNNWFLVLFTVTVLLFAMSLSTAAQTTLEVWGWDFTHESLGAAMPVFKEAHPDIDVEFRVLNHGDLYQGLLLAISSGHGLPDVVVLESTHVMQFAEPGGLLDITELAMPHMENHNDYKWSGVTYDDKIYAMPWDSGPIGLYYRRDVFEQAGLPSEPKEVAALLDTWEDYYEVAKIIKEKTGSYMIQLSSTNNDALIFKNLLHQRGGGYFNADGSVGFDSPEAVEILDLFGRMYEEELVYDIDAWDAGWYAAIADGSLATMPTAAWMGGFMKEWIAPDSGGTWGVVPLPIWQEGDVRASNDGGSNLAIPAGAKNKEAALKYVEFMMTDPEAQMAMFKAMDAFPSLETVYDDPFFDEPDPYFGGQAYRRLFAEIVQEIPSWYTTSDYMEVHDILGDQISLFLSGQKSAEETIADAAQEVRRRTRRP